MLFQSKDFPSKNNELNQFKYISTYKMGQIGITKLIEEPFKTSLNKENNLSSQHIQINQSPSNNNTNNTNTNNTNTNTNTNTYKAIDNISNKKIIKNHHSSSHNVFHNQSSSDFNCYKKRINKSNKKANIMNNKIDKNEKNESVKLNKNQFSKTTNNLCLYMNNIDNNIYNKNSYKNSKAKIKSKSNSKIQSVSEYSNYILSSRTPSSIKRNPEKLAISKLTGIEKNEKNTNSFQKDNFNGLYLKTSNNQSCMDIIQNSKKKKEEAKLDTNYQMTEFNTYLKVRKRSDIQSQKYSNSNIKTESNKLISSCFLNKENKNNELSEIKDNIYLSEVLSNEDNIKGKPKIKLIYEGNKNTNRLYTETNQKEKELNSNFEDNISPKNKNKQNINKNIYISNNFYNNKRKSSMNKNKNKFGFKTYSQTKNIENYSTKSKDKKEENININNFNKTKSNYNSKNKNSYKSRKNYSVNTSKKQAIKESDIKENKNHKINFRYNSFVDINNNDNNMKKEKNNKNNNKENIINRDIKFENPEELHFFMVNLTQNYIKANTKF